MNALMHPSNRPMAARIALAGTFVVLLLGVVYANAQWAHAVASAIFFTTAISMITIAVVSWEREVATAQSAGLVEQTDQVR